jgi:hypothetical protein
MNGAVIVFMRCCISMFLICIGSAGCFLVCFKYQHFSSDALQNKLRGWANVCDKSAALAAGGATTLRALVRYVQCIDGCRSMLGLSAIARARAPLEPAVLERFVLMRTTSTAVCTGRKASPEFSETDCQPSVSL